MTETHVPPAFYIFCKTTPIQKDFLLGLCLPAIQLQLLHLLSFLKDFVLIKSVSLRGLYSIIICQIPIKLVSFR